MRFSNFFSWHFVEIPKKILKTTGNYLIFFYYYFSVGLLLRTLFFPWRKLIEEKKAGFDLGEVFNVLTFNLISRGIGAFVRLMVVLGWLACEIITVPIGIIVFLVWILLPFLTLPLYMIISAKWDPAPQLLSQYAGAKEMIKQLWQTPAGQFFLWRLNLSLKDFDQLKLEEEKEKYFVKFLKEYLEKEKIPVQEVKSSLLLRFVFEYFPIFGRFLEEKQLGLDDARRVTAWYEREAEEKKTIFGDLKSLLKGPRIGRYWSFGYTINLDRYCQDLTVAQPFFHQLVGRPKEVSQIERVLNRRFGNNVLLVGEPGVGRRTVVLQFAKKIIQGETTPWLLNKRVLLFNLDQLLGENFSDLELKAKVETILREASFAGNVILVIENFEHYVSSGEGRFDLTGILTKVLSQAKTQVIGITTASDFAKFIYPNQELLKNFEKIEVLAPTPDQALTILENAVFQFENRNRLWVTYQALKEIISKADKYVTHIPFPEKAIDLLDEICVFAASRGEKIVFPQAVQIVISEKTKIPLGELTKDEKEKLKNLEERMHQRVVDQEEAIKAIARALRRTRMGITQDNKPMGSFLFLGPTGVGKTETAKALASIYFGSEKKMIRFDMSEYQEEASISRIIGLAISNEPGIFVKKIRDNPFSLLLLDEIEKANPKILNLFLVLLDEGYFTDAFGQKVDCRNLMIIATSNAGTELIRERIGEGMSEETLSKEVVDYIQKKGIFSPEFLNRFDAVVVYKPLDKENLRKIALLLLEKLNQRLKEKGIAVKITDYLLERVVDLGYEPAFGARPMNRVIQDKIEDQIAQKMLSGEVKKGQEIEVEI